MGGTLIPGPPATQTGGGLASLLNAGHHTTGQAVVTQVAPASPAPQSHAQSNQTPEAMTEVENENRAEVEQKALDVLNKNLGSSVISYKGA